MFEPIGSRFVHRSVQFRIKYKGSLGQRSQYFPLPLARDFVLSRCLQGSRFQETRRETWDLPDNDDMIYFAVGCDAGRSWPNLSWVMKNFGEKKICFLHILQPTKMIPSKYEPRLTEKQRVQDVLKEYHRKLNDSGLEGGGDAYLKMQKIEEGIVMLISRLNIKNLVMGVAASKEMVYIKSEITGYVSEKAPTPCQIWFVHDGHLIKTRYDQTAAGGRCRKETYNELVWREKAEKQSREAARKLEEHQVMQASKDATTVNASASDWSGIFGCSSSQSSVTNLPFFSASPSVVDLSNGGEESEDDVYMQTISASNEGAVYDELYTRLEKAMAELEKSKREAFEESSKRLQAERDAVGASRQAKAAEIKMNNQLVSAIKEKSLMENEITQYKIDNKELIEKITLSVEMMKRYKNELDELKAAHIRELRAGQEMNPLAESSSSCGTWPKFLSEFSYSEIEDATRCFDPSLKIDARGYQVMYRGLLHQTEVDIKILDADNPKGHSEYQQEVEALSSLRHPNIVTLIGTCCEALAIIYEHMPNGSLEDRLICKNNSSPLPWQIRICIASELCSVLVFLNSNKSTCTVHNDLKPANILIDANFSVKLSHFGLSRTMISSDIFAYKDLESVAGKEYSSELDVYSFGIILLRLLTGREAWGLTEEVQIGLDKGNFESLLDCLAGDWPYVQAQQLAVIALRCSDRTRKNRLDLGSEVLGVLRKMKASCQGSPLRSRHGSDVDSQAPPYYICPISQDVMEDPHVAADGFTYEKQGIQEWLNSGHTTSPMTNLKLEHTNLVPNRTLRSAIQEWRLRL